MGKSMLQAYCLRIDVEATTPLALDEHCGSALRGAFFRALWGRFCTNREAQTCTACPFAAGCPVATLLAPRRGDGQTRGNGNVCDDGLWQGYGDDPPRSFLLVQPQSLQASRHEGRGNEAGGQDQETLGKQSIAQAGVYSEGDSFAFGLTLLGSGAKLLPYALRALQEMERFGLGRPLQDLDGKRGRFLIREVRTYHPFTGAEQPMWQRGNTSLQPLTLCVTPEDITVRAGLLSQEQLTVHFLSPTRLIDQQHTLRRPTFYALMTRLADRLALLHAFYGDYRIQGGEAMFDKAWYLQIGAEAGAVRLIHDETYWAKVSSHSTRQQRSMPLDGFVGRATYQGDLSHLRELLVWGEVIGVGKSVTKGSGHYRIEIPGWC